MLYWNVLDQISQQLPATRHRCKLEVWTLAQCRGVGHRSFVTPEKELNEYNKYLSFWNLLIPFSRTESWVLNRPQQCRAGILLTPVTDHFMTTEHHKKTLSNYYAQCTTRCL